ncbi:MAG: hypothetical protein DHS20C09_09160 [marine bacterium B5-7]|nr:MAG: hypothetical protein DHS20C09_09160 [marine bacterium B5-7]
MPNTASFLPIPFIFGPVAGGETVPKMFRKEYMGGRWVYQILRNGFRWLGEHDPFVRATIKRSLMVLAASEATFQRVEHLGSSKVMLSGPQVGINQEEMTCLGKLRIAPKTPFRLMCIGRLLHWKGTHLSLQAFAQSKLENSELWIVGTGPEGKYLRHLAMQLDIADRVKFLDWLPREEVWKRLELCHVLLHPCLRGLVTTAHLEAMAARRPVITVGVNDQPQILFSHEMGVKVTASSPDGIVANMSTAIVELSTNRLLREQVGERQRDCVARKFIWDQKVTMLEALYLQATELHKGSLIVYNREDVFTTLH